MTKSELKEILNYIKKGATLDLIAKKQGISLRTLSRRLKPYKSEVEEARAIYKQVVINIFK